jgi:hypothetical protein
MRYLAGPAMISGVVDAGTSQTVEIREAGTGKVTRPATDPLRSTFHATLPEGQYEVSSGGERRSLTVLPGGSYAANLVPDRCLGMRLASVAGKSGAVEITATVAGTGEHALAIRTDNLVVEQPEQKVTLKPGTSQTVIWRATLKSQDAPWIAVVVPDGDSSQRRELTGSMQTARVQP